MRSHETDIFNKPMSTAEELAAKLKQIETRLDKLEGWKLCQHRWGHGERSTVFNLLPRRESYVIEHFTCHNCSSHKTVITEIYD